MEDDTGGAEGVGGKLVDSFKENVGSRCSVIPEEWEGKRYREGEGSIRLLSDYLR